MKKRGKREYALPCPFCGGAAEVREFRTIASVACINPECAMRSCGVVTVNETVAEAVRCWNTRQRATACRGGMEGEVEA